ncbi:hypothetical protein I7I53_10622 [Histoplasma capsulatum var. duboisii H88]|uniref:Uncharacterized protein n=1 Tax=Ajellomyces capsulatus (strain H88) TaxID=544711 RepID=A0A8A1L7X1_AJEC8|nr:hypothetical protein I7I53_10622 [Histoplasma capsulatum var. duboisii H88]
MDVSCTVVRCTTPVVVLSRLEIQGLQITKRKRKKSTSLSSQHLTFNVCKSRLNEHGEVCNIHTIVTDSKSDWKSEQNKIK